MGRGLTPRAPFEHMCNSLFLASQKITLVGQPSGPNAVSPHLRLRHYIQHPFACKTPPYIFSGNL